MRDVRRAFLLIPFVLSALSLSVNLVAAQRSGSGQQRGIGPGSRSQPPPSVETPPGPEATGKYGFSIPEILEIVEAGEGRQALQAYERTAADAEATGDLLTAVRAHSAASYISHRLVAYQNAIRHGRRAFELARQAQSPEATQAVLRVYTVLGLVYLGAGDLAESRRVLEEGLTAARSLPSTSLSQGALLTALSRVDSAQGDQTAALTHAREATQILESAIAASTSSRWVGLGRRDQARVPIGRREAAFAYVQLARLAIAARELDEAGVALTKASQYARIVGLADVDLDIQFLSGRIAFERGDYTKALALFEHGRADAERRSVARVLIDYNALVAQASEKLGKTDAALAAAQRAVGLIEDIRGEIQESALRASLLGQRQSTYHLAVRVALGAGKSDEAFALAERSRSRAFLDLLGNQAVLSRGRTRALAEEELRLRARLAEAAALGQDQEGESSKAGRARREAAERDYRTFLERVRRESGEAASLMSVEPVTLAEIQATLPEGTTLLEYLVSGQETVLWVVDRATTQTYRMPGARTALVGEVREFRRVIAEQAPLPELERRAQALYQRLLGPAADAIHGKRLVIVPHDVLHYLPFGALRTPDGRWLVEQYTLSTVPSASVLKFLGDKGAQAPDRIVAVGNPDLGPALALRYAEREARAVAARFPSTTTVLTRAEATEARAKQLVGQAGLLHFAVHGELSEEDPLSSALLLVPGGGEDGRLEVRELFTMDLSARLVVLSACETGLGKLSRGDELVGLQRAFLYAGTPAVVTTLWKVDDRASFLLMRSFYEHLIAKGPAESLRIAQRALMVDYPHPFAWAGFALTGPPR